MNFKQKPDFYTNLTIIQICILYELTRPLWLTWINLKYFRKIVFEATGGMGRRVFLGQKNSKKFWTLLEQIFSLRACVLKPRQLKFSKTKNKVTKGLFKQPYRLTLQLVRYINTSHLGWFEVFWKNRFGPQWDTVFQNLNY